MPTEARTYAIPRDVADGTDIARLGFHGLSVEWAARRVRVPRLVVCHLGGGCSVTAVRDGRSVDTSMGWTPLEGLPGATRSGSVDPGALLYLLRHGMSADELDRILEHESGLAALGGLDEPLGFERLHLPGREDGERDGRGPGRARRRRLHGRHRRESPRRPRGGCGPTSLPRRRARRRAQRRRRFRTPTSRNRDPPCASPSCAHARSSSPRVPRWTFSEPHEHGRRDRRRPSRRLDDALSSARRAEDVGRPARLLSAACPTRASTSASTATRVSTSISSNRCSSPTGSSAVHCSGRRTSESWLSRITSGSATSALPRSRSRSRTTFRVGESRRVCWSELAAAAASVGIEQFLAEVMLDNDAMLRVFAEAGFQTKRETVSGTIEVHLSLAPTEHLRDAGRRARPRRRSSRRSSRFFEPKSLAVIGASARAGSIGGELFRNVLRADFRGVCLSRQSIRRVRCRSSRVQRRGRDRRADRSCGHLPARAGGARRGCRGAGRRCSSALCDLGRIRGDRRRRVRLGRTSCVELVRAHGARLLGPNCLGIAVAAPRLNATFGPRALPPGNVGFSSQSGALGLAVLERAADRQLGLSAFVSVGNKADISSNDLLEYWEDDAADGRRAAVPGVLRQPAQVRACRAPRRSHEADRRDEGRTDGRRAHARRALTQRRWPARKPRWTRSSTRPACCASTHSRNCLTSRGYSLPNRLPRGRNVAVLTNAGGLGILCADACEAAGLTLPPLADATVEELRGLLPSEASLSNPVDMLGSAVGDDVRAAFCHPAARSWHRCGDRPLRAAGRCRCRGGRRGDRPRRRAERGDRQTGVGLRDQSAGTPERCSRRRLRPSRIRSRLRAHSDALPIAPSGYAVRRDGFRISMESTPRTPRADVVQTAGDRWLTPAETRELLGRPTAFRSCEERTAAETIDEARSPRHASSDIRSCSRPASRACTRPSGEASLSISATTTLCRRRQSGSVRR